jgi:HTH-type transcriptional regulator/antitoxin HigA
MLAKYIREANAEYRRIRRHIPLGPLRSRAEYDRAVAILDAIVDEIGEQEAHPLADLAEALSLSIEAYEEVHVPIPGSSGPAILQTLMEEHGLSQSDLPEIGSQGVVSEILSGKRDLNVRQIARLAARFGISPALFVRTPAASRRTSRKRHRTHLVRK